MDLRQKSLLTKIDEKKAKQTFQTLKVYLQNSGNYKPNIPFGFLLYLRDYESVSRLKDRSKT